MYILRIRPQSISKIPGNSEDKLRRRIKRIKALDGALPQGTRKLYYAPTLMKRAREVGSLLTEVALIPIEQMPLMQSEDLRIMMDEPQRMSIDLAQKAHLTIEFNHAMAVLTKIELDGSETVQWAFPASDWIFFAYPEEIIVPARQGTGLTLQELMLPKIEAAFSKIIKQLEWFRKEPFEVEAVHQYRVSIRSFRSLISMVKSLLPLNTYLKLQDIFRQKAQEGALLRELDVLLEEWDQQRDSDKIQFKEALMQQRQEEEDRLHKVLSQPEAEEELYQGLNQFIHALSMTNWHELDGLQFIDEKLHAWYRYTLEAMWEMDQFDFPSVHKIRLKSKKYRYITELFDEHMTQTQLDNHKKAKKRQKVLGEVCDALRNQEAVVELAPKLNPNSLTEARTFIDSERDRERDLLISMGLPTDQEPVDQTDQILLLDNPVEADKVPVPVETKKSTHEKEHQKGSNNYLMIIAIILLLLIIYLLIN